MWFDVKFDLRRKAQLVAGGNMTGRRYKAPYFSVVNIDTFRTDFFLGQLNDLDVAAADVGNSYLHLFTNG